MSITKGMGSNIWKDDFISELTPMEKYFYCYMFTNPRVNRCGLYKLNLKESAADLGLEEAAIVEMITLFQSCGKVLYDGVTDELMILDWTKHCFFNSSAEECANINCELKSIRSKQLLHKFYKVFKENCQISADYFENIIKGLPMNE